MTLTDASGPETKNDDGCFHFYHLSESTDNFRGVRSEFKFFIPFFDKIPLSKHNNPIWDAAVCGVTSRAVLFAHVPQKGLARLIYI